MLTSLGLNYGWASPGYMDTMYCDKKDYHGLLFWYQALLDQEVEIKAKNPTS